MLGDGGGRQGRGYLTGRRMPRSHRGPELVTLLSGRRSGHECGILASENARHVTEQQCDHQGGDSGEGEGWGTTAMTSHGTSRSVLTTLTYSERNRNHLFRFEEIRKMV